MGGGWDLWNCLWRGWVPGCAGIVIEPGAYSPAVLDFWVPSLCVRVQHVLWRCSAAPPGWPHPTHSASTFPRCPGNSTPLEQGHLQGLHCRSGWWMCTFNTICMLRTHLIHQNRFILNSVCSPAESIFVLLYAAGRGKHCQKKRCFWGLRQEHGFVTTDTGRFTLFWPTLHICNYLALSPQRNWGRSWVFKSYSDKTSSDASAGLSMACVNGMCTKKYLFLDLIILGAFDPTLKPSQDLPDKASLTRYKARNKLQAPPGPFFLEGWDPHTDCCTCEFMPSLSSPSTAPNIYVKDNRSKRSPRKALLGWSPVW